MSCRIDPSEASPQLCAFLDMLAFSEIGTALLEATDDGYNVIVGSTARAPILFGGYEDHPRQRIEVRPGLISTAAGRYQLLARYFDPYKEQLELDDFSPLSQDKIALQQIRECRAFTLIEVGNLDAAITRCAHIWASLPGSGYGQHEHDFPPLRQAFAAAGGQLA